MANSSLREGLKVCQALKLGIFPTPNLLPRHMASSTVPLIQLVCNSSSSSVHRFKFLEVASSRSTCSIDPRPHSIAVFLTEIL